MWYSDKMHTVNALIGPIGSGGFKTKKVAMLKEVDEYEKEFFKCDLHDGYSETSYLVVLKINKNKLEELLNQ